MMVLHYECEMFRYCKLDLLGYHWWPALRDRWHGSLKRDVLDVSGDDLQLDSFKACRVHTRAISNYP
jgi:hypothetical protein